MPFCNITSIFIKISIYISCNPQVLQNIDELFEREELSAAPDVGWPDCFNSGVFVFVPSLETYQALLECATRPDGSFDGKGGGGGMFKNGGLRC